MGKTTGISWTDASWNPWQGCTKVSAGCKNCYMYRDKKRYGKDPTKVIRSSDRTFYAPLKWDLPEGSRIFVCSWSDFFHPEADQWRADAWKIIESLPQYNFLILTKRPERIFGCLPEKYIENDAGGFDIVYTPKNVWLGVSVENQEMADKRIPLLREYRASVRFISVEPMLEEINLINPIETTDILTENIPFNWVIFGGESGPDHRPCDPAWIRSGVEQCQELGVRVFVKQLGGWPDKREDLEDLPEDLRIREFPS